MRYKSDATIIPEQKLFSLVTKGSTTRKIRSNWFEIERSEKRIGSREESELVRRRRQRDSAFLFNGKLLPFCVITKLINLMTLRDSAGMVQCFSPYNKPYMYTLTHKFKSNLLVKRHRSVIKYRPEPDPHGPIQYFDFGRSKGVDMAGICGYPLAPRKLTEFTKIAPSCH